MLRSKLHFSVRSAFAVVLVMGAAATSSHAATISAATGEVLVNTGQGFQPLAGPTDLAAGGQVMVRPGGVAVISYGESCSVRVGSERVWTVQDKAPCKDGSTALDFTGRMGNSTASSQFGQSATWGQYLLGAAVLGGAAWGFIELVNDDDDNKSSKPVSGQ